MTPQIAPGPYGTRLDARIRARPHLKAIRNPSSLLDVGKKRRNYRRAVGAIIRSDVLAGASSIGLNTWGVDRLHENDTAIDDRHCRELIEAHLDHAFEIVAEVGDGVNEIIIPCGPAGDPYDNESKPLTSGESADLHGRVIAVARERGVPVMLETVTALDEAIGFSKEAVSQGVRHRISFMLDRAGCLLQSGQHLGEAQRAVDAATNNGPEYFGANCLPIEGLLEALKSCGRRYHRIGEIRPNTSSLAPHELNGRALQSGVQGPYDPRGFAEHLHGAARQYGVRSIGVCCGGTSAMLRQLYRAIALDKIRPSVPLTDWAVRHRAEV